MRMRTIAVCAAWIALAGCAGNGEGLDENGRPIDEGTGGGGGAAADFATIQAEVLTPICTTCHSGAAAPLGLRLDEGVSYALLVNAPSTEVPALLRVNPGNPDASYLIQKLEGTAAVGGRMPLGGPPLPAETIAAIRQWILEGAQAPSAQSFVPTSLRAAWPMQNSVARDLSSIVIAMDAQVDTSVLEAGTVELRRSGLERGFMKGEQVSVRPEIAVRSLAPTVLAITSHAGWSPGTYELRISGTAPLAVTDLDARAIDGDADGVAGGDFVLRFDVEAAR